MSITPPPTPIPSRDDPNNFDPRVVALLAWLVTFVPEANATEEQMSEYAALAQDAAASAVASPNTQATSTSNLSLSAASKTLNIETGKSIVEDMWVAIIDQADGTRWMAGPVDSYDTGTGELIVSSQRVSGGGSGSSWRVYAISPMLPDSAPRTLGAGSTVKDPAGTDRAIGYLGSPPITVNTAHVLTAADVGRTLELFAGGSITVPLNSTFPANPGDIILIREMAGGTKSITPAGGVTLRQSGTGNTGARTLKAYGEAAITFTSVNNLVFIAGDF